VIYLDNISAQFVDFAAAAAATDAMGNGFVHVHALEPEILDLTKKRGVMLQRIKTRKATGHPTRYLEVSAAQDTAAFKDPRNLATTYGGPTRIEKAAFVKAITNGINFGHFDMEVNNQQGIFTSLDSEDLDDMVGNVLRLQDAKLWTGSDTALANPTTNEYVGLLTQITQTATIASGTTITQAIRAEVARLDADTGHKVRPSIIVMNPLTQNIMEEEEIAADNTRKFYEVEVVAGIKVLGIMTCMGILPIIADPFLPVNTVETNKVHKIAILTEDLLTRYYVGSDIPRVFQMGTDESLVKKYMALQYDCIVAKGASYAHTILTKNVAVA